MEMRPPLFILVKIEQETYYTFNKKARHMPGLFIYLKTSNVELQT
jgi:hypothetical protein